MEVYVIANNIEDIVHFYFKQLEISSRVAQPWAHKSISYTPTAFNI